MYYIQLHKKSFKVSTLQRVFMEITFKEISSFGKKNNYQKEVRLMARKIIRRFRDFSIVTPVTYQTVLPEMDFTMPKNRKVVGDALGLIWNYCNLNKIPYLNFLVIRKNTRLPGAKIVSWFKNTFGSLNGYEGYCVQEMNRASYALSSGLITFEVDKE